MPTLTPHPIAGDFNAALYRFMRPFETFVPRIYNDGTGVPTLGLGYALATKNAAGTWVVLPSLPADLQSIGITLLPWQTDILDAAIGALNGTPVPPSTWTGARVYESRIDADGLQDYHQRAGAQAINAEWHGRFLRRFWYEELAQQRSRLVVNDPFHDLGDQQDRFREVLSLADRLATQATQLVYLTQENRAQDLETATAELAALHRELGSHAMMSPVLRSLTVALNRELQNGHARTAAELARQHLQGYLRFRRRVDDVVTGLEQRTATATARGEMCALAVSRQPRNLGGTVFHPLPL